MACTVGKICEDRNGDYPIVSLLAKVSMVLPQRGLNSNT